LNSTQEEANNDYLNSNNDAFTAFNDTNYLNQNDFMPMSPSDNPQEYGGQNSTTINSNDQFTNFDTAFFESPPLTSQQEQQQTPSGQSSINWSGQNLDLFSSQPTPLPTNDYAVVLELSLKKKRLNAL
jgi:hypothetical protein